MTPGVLLLWDVDLTLLHPAGFGRRVIGDVFAARHGRPATETVPFAGRTDRAILTDVLRANGVDPEGELDAFRDAVCAASEERRDEFLRGGGHALPGADAALNEAAALPGVAQGVLTGNMRRTGILKLEEAGLLDRIDLTVSAFGDHEADRAALVDVARARAAARGIDASGRRTVIVGDTPDDIAAALTRGATAVGVCTGYADADTLRVHGAHLVLPDLRDTGPLIDVLDELT